MNELLKSIQYNINRDLKIFRSSIFDPINRVSYDKIIPGLYLGNYLAARNYDFIVKSNINLVLNCTPNIEYPKFYSKLGLDKKKFKAIRIPVNDSRNQIDLLMMNIIIPKICPIMHDYLTKNKNIYVHCYAGKQRSAAIVICYLIYKDYIEKKNIKPLKKYYKNLKSQRPIVFDPSPTFKQMIRDYHMILNDMLNPNKLLIQNN
jgi:protein-tyrosine phosphatase